VQGEGGGADGAARSAVLALRTLALVQVGQLAAAGAPELQEVRRPTLLVAQQEKHRLRRLRSANKEGTNRAPRNDGERRFRRRNRMVLTEKASKGEGKRQLVRSGMT
jgi:hypothetical protein